MKHLQIIIGLMSLVSAMNALTAAEPTREEMWKMLQSQSQQIKVLEAKVAALSGDVATTNDRLELVADVAEQSGGGTLGAGTKLGGYGELHYNQTDSTDQIDFHRFVAFLSHDFNERIRFFSEVELEHSLSGSGKPGEVELEQAYVEMDLGDKAKHHVKAGQFLIPVGILNETHEPPTFYGVERNNVEKYVIPSTWWEAGLALNGQLTDELRYDLAYTSGLSLNGDYDIRGGRQKVAKAAAEDAAYTARLIWQRPGLQLGGTVHYQEDMTQKGSKKNSGTGVALAPTKTSGLLTEVHADISYEGFGLRALYARWDLGDVSGVAEEQQGWYLEPSYRINEQFGIFARYSVWDNIDKANNPAGGDFEYSQVDFGINYWPHEDVVLKLDYQMQDTPSGADIDGFNLGVGFQF